MSSPATRSAQLLHADEEQLDRSAIALRSGKAFLVIVCASDLRASALGRMRTKVPTLALPDPVEVGDPWQMLDALVEQVGHKDRVLSLTLGSDVMGALDALNLHREKVRKGGPVILWLPDVDALMTLRERAPDAFSFRSTIVVLRGDGGQLPALPGVEPEQVGRARRRLKRARTPIDRAAAGQELAYLLGRMNQIEAAAQVARRALLELGAPANDDDREISARLCRTLSTTMEKAGKRSEALYWAQRGLAEAELMSLAHGTSRRALMNASWLGPFQGCDRARAREALDLVERFGLSPEVRIESLWPNVEVAVALGDLPRARRLLQETATRTNARPIDDLNRTTIQCFFAEAEGKLVEAETSYRRALGMASSEGVSLPTAERPIALLMIERGEHEAAERILAQSKELSAPTYHPELRGVTAALLHARGDLAASVGALRAMLREAADHGADGYLLDACSNIGNAVEEAADAERLSAADIASAQAELEVGEDLIASITGPDAPPWYRLRLLSLHARLSALAPATITEALDLDRDAQRLAAETYPDLLPEIGCTRTDHLLRAGKWDEVLAVVAEVDPYAVANGYLRERARLLAARLLALVQRGDPPDTLAPHLAALRDACAATTSRRITAETLRDLAKRLPPACTTPDPYALAEEAALLFVAMPIPAEDARCQEIMGDVLAARGKPEEAKRRYQTARARLERYGLGLRLPLLTRKIDALG